MTSSLRKLAATALAGVAAAVMFAVPAGAQPTVQDGSSVDTDGTQGDWRTDPTGGMNSAMRPLTTNTSTGHTITSDACYVKNDPHYCPPPMKSNAEMIQESNGTGGTMPTGAQTMGHN